MDLLNRCLSKKLMATPQPANAMAKVTVKGTPRFNRQSFISKKTTLAAPMQGLEHIIFNNTGIAKATSTFNLNIEAISKHIANRLKFDGPLAALAICKLKEPLIPSWTTRQIRPTLSRHQKCRGNITTPTINKNGGMKIPRRCTIS